MTEYPPILTGSEEQQIAALRDYLVRLARAENDSEPAAARPAAVSTASSAARVSDERAAAARLRALVIKNAGALRQLENRVDGIDGQFFYIRYSPVANPTAAQITTTPREDTAYMGVCSTKESAAPTAPGAYVWSRILGEDALSLQIISSNGNIFKNGRVSTTLTVKVWSGDEEITDLFDANDFRWTRVSADTAGDQSWNQEHFGGSKSITITGDDVSTRATFFCDLV